MDGELKRVANDGWKTTTRSKNLVILYHDLNNATATNLGDMIDFIKVDTKKVSEDEAKSAEAKAAEAKKEADTARKAAAKKATEAEKKAEVAEEKARLAKEKADAAKKDIGPGDFAPL